MATAAALAIALGFARLAARDPKAGGPCAYAQAAFGRRVGFLAYLFYVIICWVASRRGDRGDRLLRRPVSRDRRRLSGTGAAVLLIALLTLLNSMDRGAPCSSMQSPSFAAAARAAGSELWLAALRRALFRNRGIQASFRSARRCRALAAGSGLFSAWRALSMRRRWSIVRTHVAVATLSGVLLAALVYIAASAAIFGLVPVSVLSHSNAPFADATRVLLAARRRGCALAALIKTVGTLSGWILLAADRPGRRREGFCHALSCARTRGAFRCSRCSCPAALPAWWRWPPSQPPCRTVLRLVELSVLLSLSVYAVALAALLKRDAAAGDRKGCSLPELRRLLGIVFCAYVIGSSTAFVLWTLAALCSSPWSSMPLPCRALRGPSAADGSARGAVGDR